MLDASLNCARLLLGSEASRQKNVIGSPSGSLDAEPFRNTLDPRATVCPLPALARGRELTLDTTTSSGSLSISRSLTTKRIEYDPATSMVMVGVDVNGPVSTAALPTGRLTIVQRYVNKCPSGSVDAVPLSPTTSPKPAVRSGPARAVGGRLMMPHCGLVQRLVHVAISLTVIRPSLSASRGSSLPRTGRLSETMMMLISI